MFSSKVLSLIGDPFFEHEMVFSGKIIPLHSILLLSKPFILEKVIGAMILNTMNLSPLGTGVDDETI